MWFKLTSIADAQRTFSFLARIDHATALDRGNRHWLLTKDMLTGFGCANGVFAVHSIGEHDVDNVDRVVVGYLVKRFIVVNVLGCEIRLRRACSVSFSEAQEQFGW